MTTITAFISKAAMDSPDRRLGVGAPAAGFLEPANRGPESAHLVGRGVVDFQEWAITAVNTLPPSPWERARDATPRPKLSAEHFEYARLQNVNFSFVPPPAISYNWGAMGHKVALFGHYRTSQDPKLAILELFGKKIQPAQNPKPG